MMKMKKGNVSLYVNETGELLIFLLQSYLQTTYNHSKVSYNTHINLMYYYAQAAKKQSLTDRKKELQEEILGYYNTTPDFDLLIRRQRFAGQDFKVSNLC